MPISKRFVILGLILVTLMAGVGLVSSRVRPFIGTWVFVGSPVGEYEEYWATGEVINGEEAPGELMRGRWREVGSNTLRQSYKSGRSLDVLWQVSAEGELLTLTYPDGSTHLLRRR
ncbi:MAG TPA: hypothetical protein VEX38_04225 [Fimbriimonadaceae bacterium]|nr:hypothetical protein [Fimbriimonadaceae bacterium]